MLVLCTDRMYRYNLKYRDDDGNKTTITDIVLSPILYTYISIYINLFDTITHLHTYNPIYY